MLLYVRGEPPPWWQRVTEHATFVIPEGGEALRGGPGGNRGTVLQEPQVEQYPQ